MSEQETEDDIVVVEVKLERDQHEFLKEIAKGLRVGVDTIITNAVVAGILGAAYPKDEARIQYVTMQARVDKWRRGTSREAV